MHNSGISVALACIAMSFGCATATGSGIVTGSARPPTNPSEVKLYLDPPPSQYETIGLVEASSEVEFSTQAAQDRVIDELRAQAAKLGANGVLLLHSGDKPGDSVGFYSKGTFYSTTSESKVARGRAIFVPQE
jgi:hypothetical protein